jgi:hypothetical protein
MRREKICIDIFVFDIINMLIIKKVPPQNMIKRIFLGSKYVNVPANNISSWSASSRGTISGWGADIEQSKVSDVPSSNSKTSSFQKRRIEST